MNPPSVATGYRHYDKHFEPDKPIALSGSTLKWYNLASIDADVPMFVCSMAREFLQRESASGALNGLGELGFVILHRCGVDFYFLIVNSWRNENELWETVYAKNGAAQTDFSVYTTGPHHRGTYCVWELVAVWHETGAFREYLLSLRDEPAKSEYLNNQCRGPA